MRNAATRVNALPRSSWADYDNGLISKGGGIFPRSMKAIKLSPQARAVLDIAETSLEPTALITAILKSPADLIWSMVVHDGKEPRIPVASMPGMERLNVAEAAKAAASHTGSLAGSAKVYGAAFQQAGVVQASDLNNLFDRTLALSLMPPLKGTNVLLVTNGGGVGVHWPSGGGLPQAARRPQQRHELAGCISVDHHHIDPLLMFHLDRVYKFGCGQRQMELQHPQTKNPLWEGVCW